MEHEAAMIGQGECQKCNKLAEEVNALKMQLDLNHVAFRQREELMQAEIDSLVQEKRNNLCRCEGFNTGNVGD